MATSGGGYRAAIATTAALAALDRVGLRRNVEIISCVSGSCLAAAKYVAIGPKTRPAFETYRAEMTGEIGDLDLARTAIAAELSSAGGPLLMAIAKCFGQATSACMDSLGRAIGTADATRAIGQFVGDGGTICPLEPPVDLAAAAAAFAVATIAPAPSFAATTKAIKSTMCFARNGLPLPAGGGGHVLADLLAATLLRGARTQAVRFADLPAKPLLVVNATTTDAGALWSVSNRGAVRYLRAEQGRSEQAQWAAFGSAGKGPTLVDAVAASSCHPAFCRPIEVADPGGKGALTVTDGGVFDNIGAVPLSLHAEHWSVAYDLLVVVDARGVPANNSVQETRVGTLLKVHDLLLREMSSRTVSWAVERERKAGRPVPVVVTLMPGGIATDLAKVPTDLAPLGRERVEELGAQATAAFERTLRGNACVTQALKGDAGGG